MTTPALSEELDELRSRAESAELGCEIAYRREPTQAEADAFANGSDETFVPMGGWTARRCRVCSRWVFGGPTACEACVAREERDELRAVLRSIKTACDERGWYGLRHGQMATIRDEILRLVPDEAAR